jgi:hypothetical protein
VFAEYGGLANDVLGIYLLIFLIDAYSLWHPKIFFQLYASIAEGSEARSESGIRFQLNIRARDAHRLLGHLRGHPSCRWKGSFRRLACGSTYRLRPRGSAVFRARPSQVPSHLGIASPFHAKPPTSLRHYQARLGPGAEHDDWCGRRRRGRFPRRRRRRDLSRRGQA